jgi:hypothetical protein
MLVATLSTWATVTVTPWAPLYRGVDFAIGTADTNEARLQRVFALRVNLSEPTLEFFSTPSLPNGTNKTVGQTTTSFVRTYGVAVGVNANFFAPVTNVANYPRRLHGLAVSRGHVVSPFHRRYPSVLITRSNRVSFATAAPASLSNVWTAVSGSDLVLMDGVPQLGGCATKLCGENPRTAVGLSQDGHYFYLMVIDGRRKGWSQGATLYETGQWLARLGAWNGLNLDGGGSTAMARQLHGKVVLLNQPSEGRERFDGNHFGLFAQPLPPAVGQDGGADNQASHPATWNHADEVEVVACPHNW